MRFSGSIAVREFRRLAGSVVGRQFTSSALWSVLGESVSKGLVFISMVVVGRMLGAHGYGELGIIRTTINMFATVGGLGLGLTANRYVSQSKSGDRVRSGQVIALTYLVSICSGLLVGLAVVLFAEKIAILALSDARLASGLRTAALLLAFGAVNGAQIGVLQGLGAYRQLACANLALGIVAILALVGGAYLRGLDGVLLGFAIHGAFGTFAFEVAIRRALSAQGIARSLANLGPLMSILWRFSIPAALTGIAVAPFKWLCEAALARTAGFSQLGLFHAALMISTVFAALVSTFNAPLLSIATTNSQAANSPRVRYLSLYGSWYILLIVTFPCLLFPGLIASIFGPQFAVSQFAASTLLLLLYAGLMMYYQGLVRLMALKEQLWLAVFTNLAEGAALVIAGFCLIDYGATGLALACVISYLIRILVTLPLLPRLGLFEVRSVLDKCFLLSMGGFAVIIFMQIAIWQ